MLNLLVVLFQCKDGIVGALKGGESIHIFNETEKLEAGALLSFVNVVQQHKRGTKRSTPLGVSHVSKAFRKMEGFFYPRLVIIRIHNGGCVVEIRK